MLFGTNIPETDYSEWSAATTYSIGDKCIYTSGGYHKIYESLQDANLNNSPPTNYATESDDTTKPWLDLGATNRWKAFDSKVGSNTTLAGGFTYVLKPGSIDSLAMIGVQGSTARVIVSDPYSDLIENGTAWTGATGTTPPTGWDKVGSPSDLTIDTDGSLKITASAPGEGISQTVTAVPGTDLQFLAKYRNTAGEVAQYAISDATTGDSLITISGDGIVTIAGDQLTKIQGSTTVIPVTDLASSTVESVVSAVFEVPAGVTALKISLLAKSAGDVVWFDDVSLSTVIFDSPTTLPTRKVTNWREYYFEPIVETARNIIVNDIPRFPSCVVTVSVASLTTAQCGALVLGEKKEIGTMKYSPSVGIIDYSVKATDEWGNYTITERAFSQRLDCDVHLQNTKLDETFRLLALYRASLLVWVGYADFDVFILYGKWNNFSIVVPFLTYSICSLQIEGIT